MGKSFAEKILKDGSIQTVDVNIEPYGFDFVNIISGLQEGDVLKNQGGGLKSGRLRGSSSKGSVSGNKQGSGNNRSGGMPAGSPPPGGRP